MEAIASIPSMITWVAATIVTAAQLNSQIRDAQNFQLAKPYFNGYNNAGVSCTNSTNTLIPWDTETEDNDSMHSTVTNPSRLICQTPGVFTVEGKIGWAGSAVGVRILQFRLNSGGAAGGGTQVALLGAAASAAGSGTSNVQLALRYRFVNIGDYLEVFGFQSSGGTLATASGTPYITNVSLLWEIA